VRQKSRRLDLADSLMDQLAELVPLLVSYCCAQVLDLDQPLAHEHDLRDFGNSSDPGITNQLWIE
jgi:hypothetical protein